VKLLTPLELAKAMDAWDAFASEDAKTFADSMASSWKILVAGGNPACFYPLRRLISWNTGTPFSQKGGRSTNIQMIAKLLLDQGFGRVLPGSPYFDALFDDYARTCAALGKTAGRVNGADPHTSREFWISPLT